MLKLTLLLFAILLVGCSLGSAENIAPEISAPESSDTISSSPESEDFYRGAYWACMQMAYESQAIDFERALLFCTEFGIRWYPEGPHGDDLPEWEQVWTYINGTASLPSPSN